MPATRLSLREEDVVKIALEFLHNRDLHVSQITLERETGVVNGNHSDDVLFLRQLIIDGRWDDCLEFIQPLEALETCNIKRVKFIILKQKYMEMLCVRAETGRQHIEGTVDEVVKVLDQLEKCATEEEHAHLRLLLTRNRMEDRCAFERRSPAESRMRCFGEVHPLIENFLPSDKSVEETKCSKNDRLVQIIIKGMLYESCVNYCRSKAAGTEDSTDMNFTHLLEGTGLGDSDLSLLSWLQSVPAETFGVPFERRTLDVDVERLERPSLETSWLAKPNKPKSLTRSLTSFSRPWSAADLVGSYAQFLPTLSTSDMSPVTPSGPGFRLSADRNEPMIASVDRLFQNENVFSGETVADRDNSSVVSSETGRVKRDIRSAPADSENSLERNMKNVSLRDDDQHVNGSGFGSHGITYGVTQQPRRPPQVEIPPPPTTHPPVQYQRSIGSNTPPRMSNQHPAPSQSPRPISADHHNLNGRQPDPAHSNPEYEQSLLRVEWCVLEMDAQTQARRVARLFDGQNTRRASIVFIERAADASCDVHRKDSLDHKHAPLGARRESLLVHHSGPLTFNSRRRDSIGLPASPPTKEIEHPSAFPSMLRKDSISSPAPRKDSRANRNSIGSISALSGKRDSLVVPPTGLRDWNRDSMGSTGSLLRKLSASRRLSIDSLDSRRNSWDPSRRGSVTWEDLKNPHTDDEPGGRGVSGRPRFLAVATLEDAQAIRCAEFHPSGELYAVGSNSKTLRICSYPDTSRLRDDHKTYQPTVVFKRTKHHKGSLYCLAWSPAGDLLATGSNDKTVKLMRFNSDTANLEGQEEVELMMHDGTIRDLCFIEDTSNKSSLLISAGAGDCKIYVTDCATGNPFQALSGHSGHVLSLYNWGGALFVSGSQDRTIRFWDLRTRGCINVFIPPTSSGSRGSPVGSVSVEPSGRLLVSGHEDASCCLYDVRRGRTVQTFRPHSQDVRSVRFSPAAYYLLTAGYDSKLVLTDLQGDLTAPLPSVVVATHQDKVISGRWHPKDFSFLSTSADKTATLWALPPA